MMSLVQIAEHLLWLITGFNVVGLAFQIKTNQGLRSTDGVSFWMLWSYHVASVSFAMFIFLLWLPLPLRIMIPLEALMLTFLVGQEVWFARSEAFRRKITVWHGGLLIVSSFAWYLGLFYPYIIGNIAGWVAVFTLSFSQFPQILIHWRRKSVAGFSRGYLYLSILGTLTLLWCTYILSLPLQNWVHGVRALTKRLILWWQVIIYPRD